MHVQYESRPESILCFLENFMFVFLNNLRNKNIANRHVAAHFMYRTLFGLFSFFSLVSYISPILYYALHVKYSAEMSKSQLKVHYIFDVTNE